MRKVLEAVIENGGPIGLPSFLLLSVRKETIYALCAPVFTRN